MSDSTLSMTQNQSYFRLNDLPYELQYEIVKHATGYGWTGLTLLDIACVNSHLKEIATKLMNEYAFDHVEDFHGYKFQDFIRAMTSEDGARAVHMRRLHLTNGWYDYACHFVQNEYTPQIPAADHFGMWAMEEMKGLRELLVCYPDGLVFLGVGLAPNLQTLIVRPEGLPGYRFKKEAQHPVELAGTVNAYFLETALRSKSLKTLDLGGQNVINEDIIVLTENPIVKESPIEYLKLKVGAFSDKALIKLLQAPCGLRSFESTPPTFEDVNYQNTDRRWTSTFDSLDLPFNSTFGTGLAAQADTLESLTIRRVDAYWAPSLDMIGSLADFHVLKHLDVHCTMLLGWTHCEHLRGFDQNEALSPASLAALLPTSIETLTLRFEDYHNRSNNGTDYILRALSNLKTASRTRLTSLRTVTFNLWNTLPYCEDCEEETQVPEDILSWRSAISAEQIRNTRLFARDARFEFKIFAGNWDDEDWWSDVAEASTGEDDRDGTEVDESETYYLEQDGGVSVVQIQ